MASRVNTRFVIILIVGVFALLAMVLLAYSVAYKSAADLSKQGDVFMAQGDFELAERAYSKSVNKDPTNPETLGKWILALSERIPATETEYRDRFYGDYFGAIKKVATTLRNDVDAHDRFLSLRHDMLKATGNRNVRSLADAIIEETNGALAFFREDPSGVEEWERLKRYRGLAIVRIARSDGLLEEEQYTQAQEDLERVLEVDPDDAEAAIGLFTISSMIKNRELVDDDYQGRLAVMGESLEATNAFLKTHPDNVEMMMYQLLIGVDIARREIVIENEAVDRSEKIKAMLDVYLNDLNSIARLLLSSSSDQLNETTLGLFSRLENFISPESNLGVSREMTKILVESDPENAELLWSAGRISNEAGESDEAFDWYARIGTLETKPLSFAGMRQFGLAREALLSMATIRVDQAQSLVETADQSTVDAATKIAAEIRDGYAAAVTDENLSLMMLDGKLARVNGELDEALRLFKKYNEQTQRLSTEGLWQEGITASQMGQFGVAKKALLELIPLDNTTRKLSAMLTLAQIETKLKDYAGAAQLYEEILISSPNLEHAIDRLAEINMLLNPELNEDPVVSAVLTARQMKLGTETTPGDFAGAIEFLRTAIEEFNYDPILAREITAMLLDKGDIATARTIIAKSAQLHPDDDSLKTMLSVLASDDTVDIRIALQRESDRDELDILIAIAKIASDNDRSEILAETVAQLKVIAPDDKRIIEFSFLDAIKSGNLDEARAIAERSQNTQVESLAFKARIEITAGNKTKAIELLEQAAATGMADASIYRILANLQREAGLVEDSIKSFESALAIRPDNPQTCTEYLWTLAAVGRYEEGLAVARRLQRYGATNPTFMNIWLNLESVYGGSEGREFAIHQRERMLELDRTNADNMFQLARMYITTKQWDASRALINELRTQDNILPYVELDATWYADQGTYKNRDGLEVANQVFAKYIESLEAPVGAEPYVANAEFMLTRGRPDLAVVAANEAVKRQSSDTMLGSILLGDLYLRINNLTEAVKAYKAVIDSDADPDSRIRSQLVTTLTSLGRFEEAQEIYTELPEEMRNSIVNMLQASDIARGLGDDAKSTSILNDAVSRYPNNPFVYITRAQSMIGDESLLNDVLSDISRAIDLQSNNWQAYRVRAAAYFAVDRKDEGLKDLRAAIRINPNHDKSIFAVLNELLNTPGREGEAMDVAREVVSRRPDDAILMSRIGGLFKSRFDWEKSAEMYGMAWEKRRAIGDGAEYIDSLVRQTPPEAKKANEVIKELSEMVGDINKSAGLLAAQALVLQARGREDFALQQMTKAFDLTVNDNNELLNWSGNLTRYFENQPLENQIEYLEALKRRNTIPEIQSWLDLFIVRRMVSDAEIDQRHLGILEALKGDATYPEIQVRAFRIHGSTLFSQNKFAEAAAVWEKGLTLFSDDWEMSNNLAYVLASELDEPEKALSYGQTAIDQNIQRSEAYETMAGIYIRLGKYDEAEQMLDIGSNFVNSIQARVMMLITSGRLELARGNTVEAHSKLTDAQSVLRSSPTAQPSLEKDIESFEEEINSAEG